MKRRIAIFLGVFLAAGCHDKKSPAAAPSPPAPVESPGFAAARKQFLDAISDFETHAWDPDGTARRKSVNALADAGEKLAAIPTLPEYLPAAAFRRATKRVASEASAFSQTMNIVESTGKPLDQGLPWPFEFREAAAMARCLLTEAQLGTPDKRQTFARLAALLGVLEVLSEDAAVTYQRSALTELYGICNGCFTNHKDLTHEERDLLNSVIATRFGDTPSPVPLLNLRTLRQKLVELAKPW